MGEANDRAPQWAIVEIMGFRKHVGIVSEVQRFGVTMMRLEALGTDGAFEEHLYGGASIFSVTPTTEEKARASMVPRSFGAAALPLLSPGEPQDDVPEGAPGARGGADDLPW